MEHRKDLDRKMRCEETSLIYMEVLCCETKSGKTMESIMIEGLGY